MPLPRIPFARFRYASLTPSWARQPSCLQPRHCAKPHHMRRNSTYTQGNSQAADIRSNSILPQGRVVIPDYPIEINDRKVSVNGKDLPNIWLRDNCQCSSCMHPDTKQRMLDTFTIPQDIAINNASVSDHGVRIEWSDNHSSLYPRALLLQAASPPTQRSIIRLGLPPTLTLWGSEIGHAPPIEHHPSPSSSSSSTLPLAAILSKIRTHGFCYIDATPPTPSATSALLTQIAFIRPTHYGAFYDFTSDLSSADTAYTTLALPAHTDTTYFSDPAGLQAFHLLSHTRGAGGASLLVDGFKAASDLHAADPAAYAVLSSVNVHAHASGNRGISIQAHRGFPVLQHDGATGALLQVRWNTADRAGVELPVHEAGRWYDAARKFDALLKKRENEYWEQLTPGRVLVFDNWRVLHGRSAFTGERRVCGGYVNRDDWISKYKMVTMGQEKVLAHLASG
ncbi:hypothetical protein BDV95DRAFT_676828 [Massariosphaeria phaeospora]|uniref:Trimethyllysine dioxygenase n=1 Tax=Massariosphaeria phaeospora TaxID=100035 RepID=A0A7C8I6B8_9PLEO|nr:hypothetical protein BDV95DRAFT_676828 [Massariosphaeria phaeospora]